jgi:hypothetical protein
MARGFKNDGTRRERELLSAAIDTQRFRMLLCSSNLALGMVFIIV